MLSKIGLIIVLLGLMAADSPSLLAPVALIGIGALLIWIGLGTEGGNGL